MPKNLSTAQNLKTTPVRCKDNYKLKLISQQVF